MSHTLCVCVLCVVCCVCVLCNENSIKLTFQPSKIWLFVVSNKIPNYKESKLLSELF